MTNWLFFPLQFWGLRSEPLMHVFHHWATSIYLLYIYICILYTYIYYIHIYIYIFFFFGGTGVWTQEPHTCLGWCSYCLSHSANHLVFYVCGTGVWTFCTTTWATSPALTLVCDRVLLDCWGWHKILNFLASTSWVLGLQACRTIPG
jgi:hypothetical protein